MHAVFNIDSPIGTFPCTLWLQPQDSSNRSPFVIMNQETLIRMSRVIVEITSFVTDRASKRQIYQI